VRALAACAALLTASVVAGTPQEDYRKREVRIPMRDGATLFTAIYTPRKARGPLPILMERTCYGIAPYGADAYPASLGPSAEEARDGYIFVYQDVRGRMLSTGTFQEMTPFRRGQGVDEGTDTFDTIQWLLDHVPGHNGRVGLWGVSYPGFYAACALVDPHPALKAVSPQAPIADLFAGDDDHHNGALFLSQAFWFYAVFGRDRSGPTSRVNWEPDFPAPHPDGYRFFLELGALPHAEERYFKGGVASWRDVMAHPTYDAFWQARDLRRHLAPGGPAVLTVGGWFDQEDLFGPLQVHRRLGSTSRLVMGPWTHGAWGYDPGSALGPVAFGSATSLYFQRELQAPFFRHHLKGGPDPGLARATVFETGANQWRRFDAWPPPGTVATRLYFEAGGALATAPPTAAQGADAFLSDPRRPVPYTAATEPNVSRTYMAEDQRFAASRPDVLVYQTPELEAGLTVAGPIQVRLQVSTTGTDADWVVKVIDVYPDGYGAEDLAGDPDAWSPPVNVLGGYQQLVRGEVMRGKFRNSLTTPEPFVPGQPTLVAFTLNDVCHAFRKGHRLMVQVQGSWFPLVDRNPQVFLDINAARDEDFRPAEQRLHRSRFLASHVELPVLP